MQESRPLPPKRVMNSLGNVLVRVGGKYLPPSQPADQPFYVSTTAVSNRDYLEFARAGGPAPVIHKRSPELRTWSRTGCPEDMLDHPVVFVLHEYACQFCQWLTNKERAEGILSSGQRYVLPSLEHWKAFAAGARLTQRAILDRTWPPKGRQPTAPVASGDPSTLGLFHVYGNVFEWCSDVRKVRFKTPDGRVLAKPCNFAIGGGWATGYDWLKERVKKGDCGTVWGPAPWPMKDGGFRVCLVFGRAEGPGAP